MEGAWNSLDTTALTLPGLGFSKLSHDFPLVYEEKNLARRNSSPSSRAPVFPCCVHHKEGSGPGFLWGRMVDFPWKRSFSRDTPEPDLNSDPKGHAHILKNSRKDQKIMALPTTLPEGEPSQDCFVFLFEQEQNEVGKKKGKTKEKSQYNSEGCYTQEKQS